MSHTARETPRPKRRITAAMAAIGASIGAGIAAGICNSMLPEHGWLLGIAKVAIVAFGMCAGAGYGLELGEKWTTKQGLEWIPGAVLGGISGLLAAVVTSADDSGMYTAIGATAGGMLAQRTATKRSAVLDATANAYTAACSCLVIYAFAAALTDIHEGLPAAAGWTLTVLILGAAAVSAWVGATTPEPAVGHATEDNDTDKEREPDGGRDAEPLTEEWWRERRRRARESGADRRRAAENDRRNERRAQPWAQEAAADWAYETLGVDPTASDAEVNAAYRRLMKSCHPDLARGNPVAEKLRTELSAALNQARDAIRSERRGRAGAGRRR